MLLYDIVISVCIAIIAIILSIFDSKSGKTQKVVKHGSHMSYDTRTTYYHGSNNKIDILYPRESKLTTNPVVFGTTSYDDAVIFAANWTDYDFTMWGDGTSRFIEEQYPGAFKKLNIYGYIYHLNGDFKPLGSGLGNEFICEESVKPYRVDYINIFDHLNKSSVSMITFKESRNRRMKLVNNPSILKTNDVLCQVSAADIEAELPILQQICDDNGIKLIRIESDITIGEPMIIIGDSYIGNAYFAIEREKFFIKQSEEKLLNEFSSQKTSLGDYLLFLRHQRDLYHNWNWCSIDDFSTYLINFMIPQYNLSKNCPITITHITGPAGSGKTTLVNELSDRNIRAIDLDDITDKIAGDKATFFKSCNDELSDIIMNCTDDEIIFCGLSINLDIIAKHKYYIDIEPNIIYKRLLSRTVDSICENKEIIKTDVSMINFDDTAFTKLTTDLQIRFPGFIPPSEHIRNSILPFYENLRERGYKRFNPLHISVKTEIQNETNNF